MIASAEARRRLLVSEVVADVAKRGPSTRTQVLDRVYVESRAEPPPGKNAVLSAIHVALLIGRLRIDSTGTLTVPPDVAARQADRYGVESLTATARERKAASRG